MAGTATFGEWLGERRRALGITRDELAQLADCAPITVEKIERGDRKPSPQVARLLLAALHVPTHQHEVLLKFARGAIPASDLEGALLDSPRPHLAGLPVPLTPLIGREREAAAATGILLKPGVRLLTLTGAGGVGKTRLALRVAEEIADNFPDGVYFIPLAPISDPDLIALTIAQIVGLPGAGAESPMDTLKRELRDKRALLLVDNFEQVISAAPLLTELLTWCPQVAVLVTSREPLHLSGERQIVVPPLEVPGLEQYERRNPGPAQLNSQPLELSILGAFPSVRLFVERAEAVCEFALTTENAPQVAAICARLDGLPLAIELAAARAQLLSPADILDKLDQRLSLLTHGARDLPNRHKTMQAAIEWSYSLLTEWEQRLFSRMAVFVGGGTLDAIEAICNTRADMPGGALAVIDSLLDKNLLQRGDGGKDARGAGTKPGDRRFIMLETIREYAMARLEQEGEEGEDIRRLHAQYFLALAEAAKSATQGAEKREWHTRLEREHANLRAAIRWTLDHDELELALRLAIALVRFWYEHGHLVEGRRWLEIALAQEKANSIPVPIEIRAKAVDAAGVLVMGQGDLAQLEVLSRESLTLNQALGDKTRINAAYSRLAIVAAEREDYADAIHLFDQSLVISRELNWSSAVAVTLNNMGYLAIFTGDYKRAAALCEESLEIQRELEDTWGAAMALINMGLVHLHEGDYEQAILPITEALALARGGGNKQNAAQALTYLGLVAAHRGEYEQAIRHYAESLSLYQELGDNQGIGQSLVGLAGIMMSQGRQAQAIRTLGASDILIEATNTKLIPVEQQLRRRIEEDGHAGMAEDVYRDAWEAGRAMTAEEAITFALQA